MKIQNVVTSVIKYSDLLVLACEHRIHEVLPLYGCNNHIINFVFACVVVLVKDLQAATAFIAI